MKSSAASPPAKQLTPALTPAQKAAVVLASLPRETAKAIVSEVGDEHLGAFMRAIAEMKPPPANARLAIAQEFIAEVLRRTTGSPGGPEAAGKLLSELTDKARAEKIIAAVTGAGGGTGDLWSRAAALPTDRLLAFLLNQRVQTAAAILTNLPAARAAEILTSAPIAFAQTMTAAIARLQQTDIAVNDAIARAIEAELVKAPPPSAAPEAVSALAVDILDLLPSSLRDGLIEHLQAADSDIAALIRKSLLTFEGLADRLTEVAVAALVRTADRETLLRGLKHGATNAPETVEFLLSNISKRMADQFREELATLPAPAAADGEGAQRALVAAIKALEKSGEIKLKPAT